MIRLSRGLIVVGAVVTLVASSVAAPIAPKAAPATTAAGDLVDAAAPAPSASCTVVQNGAEFNVTVTWSDFSVTRIELWQFDAIQPLVQDVLSHPTRRGSITYTLTAAPDFAEVTGPRVGLRVLCVTGT